MKYDIRKWRKEDCYDLAKIANDKDILNNLRDMPYPYTTEDAKEYIDMMLNSDKNTTFAFAITDNDRVIGSIGVFRLDNIHYKSAEMGYYIKKEYWGKGIMTEIVKKVCSYIFKNTNIIRIFAEPFSTNIGSIRVLEKAGFQCEGTLRKNAIKNGQVLDMKMYAMLKEE